LKPEDLIAHIVVDEYSSTPKYKQLTNAILSAIESGKLKKNSLLPSINELSFKLEISRDTAEKGYRHLRKLGVVEKDILLSIQNFLEHLKFACFLTN
jgi:DNA-binding transcriptional regulator YhcF (GntR family)